MRRFNLASIFLVTLLALPFPAALAQAPQKATADAAKTSARTLPKATLDGAKRINAEQLKKDLYWVADDARGGRDTPSKGLDETAKLIADRLAAAKVKPAGDDGTYFQKITLRSTTVDMEKTRAEWAGSPLKVGDDFLLGSFASGEASGRLVYVGHGWVVKSKNIDAYQGLDVKDKIMIVAGNGTALPPGITAEYIAGQPSEDWESPLSYARKHGARGLVLIPQRFDRTWQFGRMSLGRTTYQVERFLQDGPSADASLPAIVPSAKMIEALFAGERQTGADILSAAKSNSPGPGFDLSPDKQLRLTSAVRVDRAMTQNVVGFVEGSDSKLKGEYVAIGSHYDHVGVGRPDQSGDSIYNGADDDGSGTVSMISMAEAFSKGKRPKRSILFVWHAAEEKGLWGSEYFTKFPTVPIKQIVAQINIDMIGRSRLPTDTTPANKGLTGPNEVYVIGSKMMSTELGEMSEAVNRSYLNLKYNYHYDQPNDPEQLFYRSDHYNYAVQGIPIIFFFDGIHADYHRPSDHPDKIDYEKMEKIARTVFVLASEVANSPQRPVVDKPLQVPARRR